MRCAEPAGRAVAGPWAAAVERAVGSVARRQVAGVVAPGRAGSVAGRAVEAVEVGGRSEPGRR